MISRVRLNCRGLLAGLLVLALTIPAGAAPSGPPIRIGGTLALTGPLAPTALLHKIAGEIYVDELNKGNGLLGRPVEWVLLDDQSKPDLTRSLYEKLITVDKVDLHHRALRDERHPGRHERGPALPEDVHPPLVRHAAPGEVRDALPDRGLRARAERDGAHHGLQRAGRHRQPAQDGGDRHQQVPVRAVPVDGRQGGGREARAQGACSTSSTSSARATGARWPRA